MVLTKVQHKGIQKAAEPIPITEMTTSVADHHKNKMQFLPIEDQLLFQILEELKAIHSLLEKR